MANVYRVWVRDNAGTSGREEIIVTDTLQNALAIAKAHCKWNEEIDNIDVMGRDVTIDHQAIGTQKQ